LSSEEENIEVSKEDKIEKPIEKPQKKKRRIFLKIFLAFLLLFIAFIILLQTSFFRNWALHYAVDKINESLAEKDAKLFVESIEGRLTKEIILNNVNLVVKSDTMLKFSKLDVSYNLLALFDKKIKVRTLILENPQINLTKVKDKNGVTDWNFAYLLKSDKVPDTTKKEFDWKIYGDNIQIRNASFRSLATKNKDIPLRNFTLNKIKSFQFDTLDVSDLNLQLSGQYLPDEKNLSIQNLSFNTNSDFNVQSLALNVSLDNNDLASIKDFNLITGKTKLQINSASLENFNPLKESIDYESFEKKKFDIDIITNKFDFDDLTFFLPSIKFMDGAVFLKLKAKGIYSDFKMDELFLTLPYGTSIEINGKVKSLHKPEHLYLDVYCRNANLNPKEVSEVIPGLQIPDYSHLGIVNASFKFIGEPLKFNAEAQVKSSAGNADVKGFLDLTQNELVYDAKATTQSIDIGKIIKNEKLKSSITGDFIVAGKGVDYKRMVNSITYKINNTSIYDLKIDNSSGTIKSNSGIFDVDLDYKSNSGLAKINGNINLRNLNNIVYNVKGYVQNADLSSITKQSQDKSNLNFKFDLNGSGTDPDNILGNMNFEVDNSMFAGYWIPATPLKVSFAQTDTGRVINLTSDIADIRATGKFKILELPSLITANLNKLSDQIDKNLKLDSLSFSKESEIRNFRVSTYTQNNKYDTDLSYTVKIKSLVPFYLLMKDSSLTFKCDIRGRLLNNENSFIFTTSGRFDDFKYKDSVLNFQKSVVRVFLKDDVNSKLPFTYTTDVNARFSKIETGATKIDSVYFDVTTSTARPELTLYTKLDSTKALYTNGFLNLSNDLYGINLDTMIFAYDNYKLRNSEQVQILYSAKDTGDSKPHLIFNNIRLADDDQRLSLNGIYSFGGNSNLKLSANKLNIAKFQKFLTPKINKEDLINGNIRRMEIAFEGNLDDPKINLEFNSDFLNFQKNNLGRVDAIINYHENNLKPDISFYNPGNVGSLIIKGELPYRNPLLKEDSAAIQSNILESTVNLQIASKDFQIKILEKFIPVLSDLKGKLNGILDISGKVRNPMLAGSFNVGNGSFTLDMTGVNYNFKANLTTDKQKLNFEKFEITHRSDAKKKMTLGGFIDFTNLTLNNMEFRLRGDAVLLDESVTQNIMSIYGKLNGRTGLNDLVIKGNPSALNMTGDLDLIDGRVTIVPQLKVAYNIYNDNFVYKVLLDSTIKKDSVFQKKYADSLSTFEKLRLDPFDSYFYSLNDSTKIKADESVFKYYLKMKMLNDIFVKLIVEEKSGQEFSGYVNGNVTFDNLETNNLTTRGRVDIGKNSYYKFYKSFNATGYAMFTGDVTNPDLFINANYKSTAPATSNSGSPRSVEIALDVTGKAMNPQLNFGVTVDGNPVGGSNPSDDAISFVVFGKLKDELNADQRLSYLSSVGANVGTSFASSYLSDVVNNYLPFIVKTDISYKDSPQGSFADNADIRLTAQLAGATIIFGGQILRDLSNTNFLVEYPLNNLFGFKNFTQNLILQLERYIDPFSQNNMYNTDNRTGGSLLYRIKF